jgi:predicted esterase
MRYSLYFLCLNNISTVQSLSWSTHCNSNHKRSFKNRLISFRSGASNNTPRSFSSIIPKRREKHNNQHRHHNDAIDDDFPTTSISSPLETSPHAAESPNPNPALLISRRKVIKTTTASCTATIPVLLLNQSSSSCSAKEEIEVGAATEKTKVKVEVDVQNGKGKLFEINDPNTYPALVYIPSDSSRSTFEDENDNVHKSDDNEKNTKGKKKNYPVIVLLHGAGKNELDIWNLANPKGEHAGLIPSLLFNSNKNANTDTNFNANLAKPPPELYENFVVIAPYSIGRRSFYEEPRSKIIQFVKWACKGNDTNANANESQSADNSNIADRIDLDRIFLFGFSDGATLGVELMTTNIFKGGIFAAYGFTGKLPSLAIERLKNKPMWIFHSADDVIFPVSCSDRLVKELRSANTNDNSQIVRYTRFDKDQEGFTGSVKGHSTGITASKDKEVYKWLLSL